jgi:hypothetical protein
MLLNGAAQIEETAMQFPQFALIHSVTCGPLRLITILGNCGYVAVASFLVPTPLQSWVSKLRDGKSEAEEFSLYSLR